MSSHATAEGLPIATRPPTVSTDTASHPARQTWDYVDEVVQMLKTAFPLLVVSMEGMVEQVQNRFRGGHDEEVYRLLCMVATDAMNVRHCHFPATALLTFLTAIHDPYQ